VLRLCEEIAPGSQAVFLDVESSPNAIPLDCYQNVAQVVAAKGGSVQYGWQIWMAMPGVMIEAEFHAVWIDDRGNLHDVTPKPGIHRILFLPDPNRRYEGRQINNVRMALRADPMIKEFIEAADEHFAYMNRGELADFHGYIATDDPKLRGIMLRQARLLQAIVERYYPAS
jgi:hypothetical protein